jgi:hypothetical protein
MVHFTTKQKSKIAFQQTFFACCVVSAPFARCLVVQAGVAMDADISALNV